MSFIKTALLLGLASFATATTYAQFCDDTACTVNCGTSVSTDNPGCTSDTGRFPSGPLFEREWCVTNIQELGLQEYNRMSILYHDDNIQDVRLVYSPDENCSCQQECEQVVYSGGDGIGGGQGCTSLEGHAISQSYRFVGGATCDPNNC